MVHPEARRESPREGGHAQPSLSCPVALRGADAGRPAREHSGGPRLRLRALALPPAPGGDGPASRTGRDLPEPRPFPRHRREPAGTGPRGPRDHELRDRPRRRETGALARREHPCLRGHRPPDDVVPRGGRARELRQGPGRDGDSGHPHLLRDARLRRRRRGDGPHPAPGLAGAQAGRARREGPRRRRLHHPDAGPGPRRELLPELDRRAPHAPGPHPRRRPVELRSHHPRGPGGVREARSRRKPLPRLPGGPEPHPRGDRRARGDELQPELVGRMAAARARRRPLPVLATRSPRGRRVHRHPPEHLLHLHDPLRRRRPELHRAPADEPSLRVHAPGGQRLLHPPGGRLGRGSRRAA